MQTKQYVKIYILFCLYILKYNYAPNLAFTCTETAVFD